MELTRYALKDASGLETPALAYYPDIIEANTQRTIARAGGAARLWPHVKSHKMAAVVARQMELGIQRFKCATIAEAQMVAACGAQHVLLSYPLVGPNIARFIQLEQAYPDSTFYALADDRHQLQLVAAQSKAAGLETLWMADVNMGMDRTGIALNALEAFCREAQPLEGIRLAGLHCYDGHIHAPSLLARAKQAQAALDKAHSIRKALQEAGLGDIALVMGGTPTFPVHAAYEGVFLSPGTVFIGDVMCLHDVKELEVEPGAGVWTRVVSHPTARTFTLDLGVKAISTDQPGSRGMLVGLEGAKPLFQSEEHWVYEMPEGQALPAIGETFFVIPTHICPTTALYPFAHVVRDGEIIGRWDVTARNRNIGI